MLIVKTKVPVRYKGIRCEVEEVIEIENVDMNENYFELIEEKEQNIEEMNLNKLKGLAKERGIEGYSKMKKEELLNVLLGTDEEVEE